MNAKRAWEVLWRDRRDEIVAVVLMAAARQRFWVRAKLAWRLLRGVKRESR